MYFYMGIQALLWDLIDFMEASIIMRFLIFRLGYKDDNKRGRIYQVLYVMSWGIFVIFNECVLPGVTLAIFFNVIPFVVYGHFFLKGTTTSHVFWYMISIIILCLCDTVVFAVETAIIYPKDSYEIIIGNFNLHFSSALICVLLFFVFSEVFNKVFYPDVGDDNYIFTSELVMCVLIEVLSVSSFVYNMISLKNGDFGVRLFIYLLLFSILILIAEYYLRSIREQRQRQRELEIVLLEDERRREHYENDRIVYDRLCEYRHDTRHHLAYIEYLSNAKEYEQIKKYIHQIQNDRYHER